jgi:hypothetical protein
MKAFKRCGAIVPLVPSTLHGREWSASQQNCLTPGKSACISHWIWCSIDPRASLEVLEDKNLLPWKRSNPELFGPQPTHRTAYSIPVLEWRMVYSSIMRWNRYVSQSILYNTGWTWSVMFLYTDSETNAWDLSVYPWLRISICNNHASSTAKLRVYCESAKQIMTLCMRFSFLYCLYPYWISWFFLNAIYIPCFIESVGRLYIRPSIRPHIKFTMNMAEAALNTHKSIPPTNTVSTTRMP